MSADNVGIYMYYKKCQVYLKQSHEATQQPVVCLKIMYPFFLMEDKEY